MIKVSWLFRNGTAYSGVATYVKNNCTPVAAEDGLTGMQDTTLGWNWGGGGGDNLPIRVLWLCLRL